MRLSTTRARNSNPKKKKRAFVFRKAIFSVPLLIYIRPLNVFKEHENWSRVEVVPGFFKCIDLRPYNAVIEFWRQAEAELRLPQSCDQ